MNELFQGDVDLMRPTKIFCENCTIEDALSRATINCCCCQVNTLHSSLPPLSSKPHYNHLIIHITLIQRNHTHFQNHKYIIQNLFSLHKRWPSLINYFTRN
jgi:hypothetical protein